MANIELTGAKHLEQTLTQMKVTPPQAQKILGRGGLVVYTQARLLVPTGKGTGSGALRRSIQMTTDQEACTIYTNSPYAVYVECGTGPTGAANHAGISPKLNPSYRTTGWVIPASAIDGEAYGLRPITSNGQVTGYYTKGQAAQPYMYPAIADHKNEILKEMVKAYKEMTEK